MAPDYWFDNSHADEVGRLRLLETIADPRSIDLFTALPVEEGWRCLELGAGGGSMAAWLAERVGAKGSVTAVDKDVALLRSLADRANVEVVEALIEEADWSAGAFDLVHTRNVLMHLAEPDEVVADLVAALRPGGTLVVEEADYFPLAGMTSTVVADVTRALVGEWTWARTLPTTISRLAVHDVTVHVDTSMLRGRSAEAEFWIHTLRSVESRLTDPQARRALGLAAVSKETFDETLRLLADDTFWTPLAAVVCVTCRRDR